MHRVLPLLPCILSFTPSFSTDCTFYASLFFAIQHTLSLLIRLNLEQYSELCTFTAAWNSGVPHQSFLFANNHLPLYLPHPRILHPSFLFNRKVFTPRYVHSYTTVIGWHSTIHCLSIDVVCILTRTAIIHHLTFRLHHMHLPHFLSSKHHSLTIPISMPSQPQYHVVYRLPFFTPGSQTNLLTIQLGRRSFMKM